MQSPTRHRTYVDNANNRRLGRVGQPYGYRGSKSMMKKSLKAFYTAKERPENDTKRLTNGEIETLINTDVHSEHYDNEWEQRVLEALRSGKTSAKDIHRVLNNPSEYLGGRWLMSRIHKFSKKYPMYNLVSPSTPPNDIKHSVETLYTRFVSPGNRPEKVKGIIIWVNRFEMVSLQPAEDFQTMTNQNKVSYSPTRGIWWEGQKCSTLPDKAIALVRFVEEYLPATG